MSKMAIMKIQEARQLGDKLGELAANSRFDEAGNLLLPILEGRTPFRLLDAIGIQMGSANPEKVSAFLDQIAARRTMGGWVVIASALRRQLSCDIHGAFERCRKYVEAADVWYATDSFGERVPGPALVEYFETAVNLLEPWRADPNPWIRRIVGVSVHYWSKQAHGAERYLPQVYTLLDLLEPMFSEREQDAIKGIGWGLKTLGRYYPETVAEWLVQQTSRPHRALMWRKATTYLPVELRKRVADEKR